MVAWQLDALMQGVTAVRPVRPLSTAALMSLLVQGVGFYFASRPVLERIAAADEIAPGRLDRQVDLFAEFILAALLPPADGGRAAVSKR